LAFSSSRHLVFAIAIQTALWAPMTVASVDAAVAAAVKIEIRVYDQAAQNPIGVPALQQSVGRVLKGNGIDVVFVDCARPGNCGEVPTPDTLVLRLAPGLHPVRARQCGVASIGEGGQRGVLMTIFRGCAANTRTDLREIAKAQGGGALALLSLSEADILSVFAIHELIHLVLPDEAHGIGLFKATLEARDWWDVASRQPNFERQLMTRLRQALGPDSLAHAVRSPGGLSDFELPRAVRLHD
jgi:hypothetical protein